MGNLGTKIFGNQIGYLPKDKKRVVVTSGEKVGFVIKKGESVLFEGSLQGPFFNSLTKEENYIADFSHIEEQGNYQLELKTQEDAITNSNQDNAFSFFVGEAVYDDLLEKAVNFFYLQRCGCKLPKLVAGEFSHEICHNTLARVYGTDQLIQVQGGWHDAGDYGRYIVAAAVTVADLLLAYEANPKMFEKDFQFPANESSIPDFLNEIKYELEWMLKMQDLKTGKVYHKVTCQSFCDFILPEDETEELIVSPESVTATADFAAVMAMAMEFYLPYDEAFAKSCIKAAIKAYDAMKGMFMPGGFRNPKDIVTGEYGDSCDLDERYWAAAQLYKATGDYCYLEDFENLAKVKIYHGYGWEDVGSFGNAAYLTTKKYKVNTELAERIKKEMIEKADELLQHCKADPYGVSLNENGYIWGSNMYVAANGNHLFDGYLLTGNQTYIDAAKSQFHYLLGQNPTGYCYMTGFGQKSPQNPHHRPSAAVKKAMPGMLVGGPDSGLHDPAAVEYCSGNSAPQCYVDDLGSYSTNEITIYWNSAFVYLMSVLF